MREEEDEEEEAKERLAMERLERLVKESVARK